MGLSKQKFKEDYNKGTLFLLEYPAREFKEHTVNTTVYSENSKINAVAQRETLAMLRRTIQGMKHGDTRPVKLFTVVCEPLTAESANEATYDQYRFANAVAGAVSAALGFLLLRKMPKKVKENEKAKGGIGWGISLIVGARVRKFIIKHSRKFNAGDVSVMTFIEVNGGIGPQYSFTGTYLTLDEY